MPLNLYLSIYASGSVPTGWAPSPGAAIKYNVKNKRLLACLQQQLPGRWKKVIKEGVPGDVHYFENESGQVADVKYFP